MTDAARSRPVYLDHNASTPVLPEVLEAMLPYLSKQYGNPSSTHVYGRIMRQAVERAREQVASLIDCDSGEICFTSGGTEANNLAIRGVAAAHPGRTDAASPRDTRPERCRHPSSGSRPP